MRNSRFGLFHTTGLLLLLLSPLGCTGKVIVQGPEGTGPTIPGSSELAAPTSARRLTRTEFDNTVRDLLFDETAPASATLNEDPFSPFDNDYTEQRASAAYISALESLSIDIASRLMADVTRRDRVVPCTPTGAGDTDCLTEFIADFVPKALRRPITDAERDSYLVFQAFATEDNPEVQNDFYTAVDLIIRAVIMDPEFMYRVEIGTPTETQYVANLTGFEIATRMSYLLWGTTPNDALLAEAADGSLSTTAGRRAAASRMLEDGLAREQLHRFHSLWLGYRAVPVDASLVPSLSRETSMAIDRVVFEDNGSYLNLFTLNETFIDSALATHYGLPEPDGGEGWVAYDGGRAGILSHGTVLSAFSKFTDTSPTQRGILVRARLMCAPILEPPANVDVDEPPMSTVDACKEDRYREHMGSPACAGCHAPMDGIGFGLENYAIGGRFREYDDGDASCTISGEGIYPSGESFSGPAELAQLLIDDGSIEQCMMNYLYQFVLGREVRGYEQEDLTALVSSFRGGDHNLQGFLVEYIASERFARKREESL